jgi:hypothetical protein
MSDKRIEVINTNQSVPKKTKIVQGKNQAPPEAGGSPIGMKIRKTPAVRRASTTRKTSESARKTIPVTRKGKVSISSETGGRLPAPSDEAIRLRAYFISERRRRFALPGDAESDWLEAKRQLLSETGPR